MTSYARDFLTFNSHQKPTVGDIKTSTISTDHMGWLLCDGRSLTTRAYWFLFQTIGYSYGGSGDNFNLPQVAGRVPGFLNSSDISGYDAARDTWTLGDISGQERHTLIIAEMPTHNHGTDASNNVVGNNLTGISGEHIHGITDLGHTHSYLGVGAQAAASGLDNVAENSPRPTETTGSTQTGIAINPAGAHQHTIANQGGNQPHGNMQPTIFVGNMYIYSGKPRQGTYPTSPSNYFYF